MPPSSKLSRPILIVAGMHRSGTSLLAALLQRAGVDIGERLIAGSEGNETGHFEDVGVVQFHEEALRAQGLPPEGWTQQENVDVSTQLHPRAKAIAAAKREATCLSGWKDPRTTLFLDFWQHFLPEAVFVLLYRAPWETVDSLYRRGDPAFANNPALALKVWMAYNRALVRFCDRHPNRSLLCSIDDIARSPEHFSELLRDRLQVQLPPLPVAELYNPARLHHQVSTTHRPILIREYFPDAISVLDDLERGNIFGPTGMTANWQKFPDPQNWVLQDWLTVRRGERTLRDSQARMKAYRRDLSACQKRQQIASQLLASSESDSGTISRERDTAQEALELARRERDAALAVINKARQERDEALVAARSIRLERDNALKSCESARLERDKALEACESARLERDKALEACESTRLERDKALEACESTRLERDKALEACESTRLERDKALEACESTRLERDKALEACESTRLERDKALEACESTRLERDKALEACESTRLERDKALEACESTRLERDKALEACESTRLERDKALEACESTRLERDKALKSYESTRLERDKVLAKIERISQECNEALCALESTRRERDDALSALAISHHDRDRVSKTLESSQARIARLRETIAWMQGSRFWHLRNTVRQFLGRPRDPF